MLLAACARGAPGGSGPAESTGLVGPVAPTVGPEALRYVALGDPFTFGDGVRQADRWPNQLVRILRPAFDLDLVANLAGRTVASQQLIEDQLPRLARLGPQFVSVQVGANDVAFDVPPADYAENMRTILDDVLEHVAPDRVIVVTTPDFTLAGDFSTRDDTEALAERIDELNQVLADVAAERGVAVVDIGPIADRVTSDPTLVAPDGNHPSAKQYAGWADLIALHVKRLFDDDPLPTAGPTDQVPAVPTPEPLPTGPPGPTASPVLMTS
jgi:lysophospholipase L1-like esterase